MNDAITKLVSRYGLPAPGECLRCDVCCRFPEADTPLTPFFSHAEIDGALAGGMPEGAFPPGRFGAGAAVPPVPFDLIYRCPAFRPESNDCCVYSVRPLDCRLYPFMLMYDRKGEKVFLGADSYCPAVGRAEGSPALKECADELSVLLDGPLAGGVEESRGIVGEWKEHVLPLRPMPELTRRLCRSDLGLRRLTSTALPDLDQYARLHRGPLSYHSLSTILLWSDVFDLRYRISGDRLLIFAHEDGDDFMIVPPLGSGDIGGAASEGLEVLRAISAATPSPRIQEVEDASREGLARSGWRVCETAVEYVYAQRELAELKGNRFEKKRSMCNRFEREHRWEWRPFESSDLPEALALCRRWIGEREARHPGELFAVQAECGFRLFRRALCGAQALDLAVRLLLAEGRPVGVTAACPLPDGASFYVPVEISDLGVKGAAQFMFRELCREMVEFELVNAGGDSGLPNLRSVKESYRPTDALTASTLVPPA
jgi:hypothetical protein